MFGVGVVVVGGAGVVVVVGAGVVVVVVDDVGAGVVGAGVVGAGVVGAGVVGVGSSIPSVESIFHFWIKLLFAFLYGHE